MVHVKEGQRNQIKPGKFHDINFVSYEACVHIGFGSLTRVI